MWQRQEGSMEIYHANEMKNVECSFDSGWKVSWYHLGVTEAVSLSYTRMILANLPECRTGMGMFFQCHIEIHIC